VGKSGEGASVSELVLSPTEMTESSIARVLLANSKVDETLRREVWAEQSSRRLDSSSSILLHRHGPL